MEVTASLCQFESFDTICNLYYARSVEVLRSSKNEILPDHMQVCAPFVSHSIRCFLKINRQGNFEKRETERSDYPVL